MLHYALLTIKNSLAIFRNYAMIFPKGEQI